MPDDPTPRANLGVTAMYTAHTWAWAGVPGADLLAGDDTRSVFRATNWILNIARWFRPEAADLPASLAQRHAVIDHLTQGASQLIETGCGLSPRGLIASADPDVTVTELDLGPVIAAKRKRLARSEAGRAVLARPNHRLIAQDATDARLFELFDQDRPVTIVAEGLYMYFEASLQRAIWARLAQVDNLTLVFDLTPVPERPRPGLVGRILGAMLRAVTGGGSFARDPRDRATIRQQLIEAGFTTVEAFDPDHAPIPLPHADRATEFVVWHCRTKRSQGRSEADPPAQTTPHDAPLVHA